MEPPVRNDGLQLDEHRAFQERSWTAERIAWILFGLLLLAALLGLTGSGGPLSRAERALQGGSIDFPRVARWEAADEMVVRFAPAEAERSLRLSPGFADALQIEGVQPEPSSSTTGPNGTVMVFDTVAGEPAQVILHVTPLQPGWPRFEASIDGGRPTAITTLVLP